VIVTAFDNCGRSASVDALVSVVNPGPPASAASVSLSSELAAETATGQIVVNGAAAVMPCRGRTFFAAPVQAGVNRVEATLVEGSGRPGTWRFELGVDERIEPGSLRVVAGEVALVTESSVTFQLRGQAGERLAFTFRAR